MVYASNRRRMALSPKKRKKSSLPRCKCGETNPEKFYGHKTAVCGRCHNQYTLDKGRENRAFAIELLGGKCVACGFNKWPCSLDIHHVDPTVKDSKFSSARNWSRDRLTAELGGCILLCRNCHGAYHSGFDIYGESFG